MPLAPLVHLLVLLSSAAVGPADNAELRRAVKNFENFEDERAAAELRALLLHSPPASVAAKAHIYLGLIALNQTETEAAKEEFILAVSADVVVDLPAGQSPKAQILFAEARREVAAGPLPKAGAPRAHDALSDGTPAAPTAATAAEGTAPSHLPAYVVGGIGVAALAAGGIFGYLQQQAKANASGDITLATAQSDAQPYAQDGLVADVLFGVGGAALITSIILFFTESSTSAPTVAVSAGPGGVALSGRF